FAEDVYQFDQVDAGGLAADAGGNLYILDRQGRRVLKYGPDGVHLATFGREGEGPGELSQPISLAVGPRDTVWITDFSNGRMTGYPQDGGEPRTIPFPDNAGVPGAQLVTLEDGFITTFRQIFGFRRSASGQMTMSRGGGDSDREPTIPLVRVDRAMEAVDTLWDRPEPPTDMVQLEAAGRIRITIMAREFTPDFNWAAFPDGATVLSDSAAYLVHILDPTGARVRTIAREPAPRPTTEADRELARQRVREEAADGIRIGGGPDEATQERLVQQRLEKMTFADLIPRIVDVRVDPAGRIWVGVSEDTPGEIDRIDVLARDGTLLGELRNFPFPDVFMGPRRIGVLRRDELDVQQVVILDVERVKASG
ncbi:MAG: hypothetical protein R3314_14950, partial [Longimicrobiales bacterium]|nr:hypothetical protein [Longimicrobiales bacterium]